MQMDWYTKRKVLLATVFVLILIVSTVYLFRGKIFPSPTCNDGKKNGIEVGVDCGGSCLLVCVSEYKPLTVSLAKAIKTGERKYDILILIDNANQNTSPKMLSVVVELYDNTGKNFKTMRSTSPAFSGSEIPVFTQGFEADNISNVIARIEPYEMYRSNGGYTMKLKSFTYNKTNNSTDIDIFYTSPYRDSIKDTFISMVVAYNSLGNVVGFAQAEIKGLSADKPGELFISLPYRTEGEIAKIEFVPLNMFYAKE